MKHSLKTGFSFGLTSGIITTLGLIVGLHAGTGSKLAVVGGILTIAIADAFSDALGIHVSEESEHVHTPKQIWTSTIATFVTKFVFAMTFIVPVILLKLTTAVNASIVWGLSLLGIFSFWIARKQKANPWKVIAEHLIIALVVIAATHYVGDLIRSKCNSNHRDTLYQVSTIEALLEGEYDGEMSFKQLGMHGDFGIGTFNALDGEMIGFDGDFYQIKADGKAYLVKSAAITPFSSVTFFETDKAVTLNDVDSFKQLKQYLDDLLPEKDIFYAIKIEGTFGYVKTRSVPEQDKPYPPLLEVLKNQPIFKFNNIKGTMVGFYCPDYVGSMNAPGYHFHFITEDRRGGGHLLECRLQDAKVEIDYTDEFQMALPK